MIFTWATAPDLGGENIYGIWKIDDTDNSFLTQPFRIKYARQDIRLSIMISFTLPLDENEVIYTPLSLHLSVCVWAWSSRALYNKLSFLPHIVTIRVEYAAECCLSQGRWNQLEDKQTALENRIYYNITEYSIFMYGLLLCLVFLIPPIKVGIYSWSASDMKRPGDRESFLWKFLLCTCQNSTTYIMILHLCFRDD